MPTLCQGVSSSTSIALKPASMKSVVAILFVAFCDLGRATTTTKISFRGRNELSCMKEGVLTYDTEIHSYRTDDMRTFVSSVVGDTSRLEASEHETFPSVTAEHQCSEAASAKGYNSFTFVDSVCKGYAYSVSPCGVGPPVSGNSTGVKIFTTSNKKKPYEPEVMDFTWMNSSKPSTLMFSFYINGLFADTPVTNYIIQFSNDTEIKYEAEYSNNMTIQLDEAFCTGQDVTIILESSSGRELYKKTFPRDVCGGGIDNCIGCVRTLALTRSGEPGKLTYQSLVEGCERFVGHSAPTVNNDRIREMIVNYVENGDDLSPDSFWVAFSRSDGSSSFTWPDGSTDLSMFGNGNSFGPRSGEDCATAELDIVSMELMIQSQKCYKKQPGFCVL